VFREEREREASFDVNVNGSSGGVCGRLLRPASAWDRLGLENLLGERWMNGWAVKLREKGACDG
jgi:hypothetical protein